MNKRNLAGLLLAASVLLSLTVLPVSAAKEPVEEAGIAAAASQSFLYQHDPRLNPTAMKDIIRDPEAVYGFRPSPDSKRLGEFASYDWHDAALVEKGRQNRLAYHKSLESMYDLMGQLIKEGKSIEEIARAVSARRNELRLEAAQNDPEKLANTKASNLETYGNENGPTADSLYDKYGSWEVVVEKSFSTNPGMDACLGLYDDHYDLYEVCGQIPQTYYSNAMQWVYTNRISDPITVSVYEPETLCSRGEAVTLLWAVAGRPAPADKETGFTDLKADSFYLDAVAWAQEEGITLGTSATTFSPDATVNRAQFVTLLMRSDKAQPSAEGIVSFTDVSADAWYADAVSWAVENEICTGTSETTFSPDSLCKRADAVTFLWRDKAP